MAGLWCTALGYGNEELVDAAAQQMRNLPFSHLFGGRSHEPAIELADGFPLDDMPDDAQRLLQLLYSLVMVSFPVEVWRQPHVPDSGAAYLDLVIEPLP